MYGFIHCCLEDMVLQLFGEQAWREILNISGIKLRGASFLIHQVYDDDMTFKLVAAASKVSGLPVEVCLEEFGKHFLVYCQKNGYDQILRVLGSNLFDFLTNLDNLHDHLASIYPGMRAPSFRVTRQINTNHGGALSLSSSTTPISNQNNQAQQQLDLEPELAEQLQRSQSMYLHYYSERVGLSPIVKGLVMAVASEFFQTDILITECRSQPAELSGHDHVVLKIDRRPSGQSDKPRVQLASSGHSDELQANEPAEPTEATEATEATTVTTLLNEAENDNDDNNNNDNRKDESQLAAEAQVGELTCQLQAHRSVARTSMLSIYNSLSSKPCDSLVDSDIMMQTFPFHVIFDRQFNVIQVGKSLLRVTSNYWRRQSCLQRRQLASDTASDATGASVKIDDLFEIVRPKIDFTFDAIADHTNQVFVLRIRSSILNADSGLSASKRDSSDAGKRHSKQQQEQRGPGCPFDRLAATRRSDRARAAASDAQKSPDTEQTTTMDTSKVTDRSDKTQQQQQQQQQQPCEPSSGDPGEPASSQLSLRLKGQMIILPESQLCLYLCSPRVDHLDQLMDCGVRMSDFGLHDRSRQLMLMSHSHKEDREAFERLDQASNDLKKMDTKLRAENKRTNEVLHNIFPAKIAALLSQGHQVESESFELVTCLYSDIIGFTKMCGSENVRPIDIVRLLNTLYLQFDTLTTIHGVFKVETIGDAYVVVGGLPEPVDDHADRCVRMGLDMVKVIATVRSPADRQPIQMRIGIHSGPVMAGIVGMRVPRYSLFGNTTTLANQLETHGVGGKIHVSDFTLKILTQKHKFVVQPNAAEISALPFASYFVTDYLADADEAARRQKLLSEQLVRDFELMGDDELALVDHSYHRQARAEQQNRRQQLAAAAADAAATTLEPTTPTSPAANLVAGPSARFRQQHLLSESLVSDFGTGELIHNLDLYMDVEEAPGSMQPSQPSGTQTSGQGGFKMATTNDFGLSTERAGQLGELAHQLSSTLLAEALGQVSEADVMVERLLGQIASRQSKLELVLKPKPTTVENRNDDATRLQTNNNNSAPGQAVRICLGQVGREREFYLGLALHDSQSASSDAGSSSLTKTVISVTELDTKCKVLEFPLELRPAAKPGGQDLISNHANQRKQTFADDPSGTTRFIESQKTGFEQVLEEFKAERRKLELLVERLNLASLPTTKQHEGGLNLNQPKQVPQQQQQRQQQQQQHAPAGPRAQTKPPRPSSSPLSQTVQRIKRMDTLRRRKLDKQGDQSQADACASSSPAHHLNSPQIPEDTEEDALEPIDWQSSSEEAGGGHKSPLQLSSPLPRTSGSSGCSSIQPATAASGGCGGEATSCSPKKTHSSSSSNPSKSKTLKSAISNLLGDNHGGRKAMEFFSSMSSPFSSPVKKANKRLVEQSKQVSPGKSSSARKIGGSPCFT